MVNIYCIHTAHAAVCESEFFIQQYNLSLPSSLSLSVSIKNWTFDIVIHYRVLDIQVFGVVWTFDNDRIVVSRL